VPFVSTDVSDLAEIARADPACRVCVATPEALADGISATLTAGAQAALRRHVEPMDLGALSRQLLNIYQSLRAARPQGAVAPVPLN
jgi:DNA-binding NarL/FixJ family response regulator